MSRGWFFDFKKAGEYEEAVAELKAHPVFHLSDLTESFYAKVIAFRRDASSGLGGPGSLAMLTEEGDEYYAMNGVLDRDDPLAEGNFQDAIPLFETEEIPDRQPGDRWFRYKKEAEGWGPDRNDSYGGKACIRPDYREKLDAYVREKNQKPGGYYTLRDNLLPALTGRGSRQIYYAPYRDILLEEAAEQEAYRKTKLTPGDLTWIPFRRLGYQNAWYCLLFRECRELPPARHPERHWIEGCRWTVLEQIKPGRGEPDGLFNLYYSWYPWLEGPLCYPDPADTRTDHQRYKEEGRRTLTENEWTIPGEFLHTFRSLEEAQAAVLEYNLQIGKLGIRKTNRVFDYPSREYEARMLLDHYEPLVQQAATFPKIAQWVEEYLTLEDRPPMLADYLIHEKGLPREQAVSITHLTLKDLDEGDLAYARRVVEKSRAVLDG